MRAHSIKLTNEGAESTIRIDNEDVPYQSFCKFDTAVHPRVDVFVDTDSYFTEHNAFIMSHKGMINSKEYTEG